MFPNSPSIRLCLLNISSSIDNIGNKTFGVKSSKEVVGIYKSITSKEYLSSTQLNISCDLKVIINSFLYDGSKYAKLNDVLYKIVRTYVNGMFIELFLESADIEVDYDN